MFLVVYIWIWVFRILMKWNVLAQFNRPLTPLLPFFFSLIVHPFSRILIIIFSPLFGSAGFQLNGMLWPHSISNALKSFECYATKCPYEEKANSQQYKQPNSIAVLHFFPFQGNEEHFSKFWTKPMSSFVCLPWGFSFYIMRLFFSWRGLRNFK